MARTSPREYIHQVKSEMKKVTWPSRQETTVSTIAVFVMVTVVTIFLYFTDQIMAYFVNLILELGM